MAWMLALVVAGVTAADPSGRFDLEGPRAEASARGRAFATLGQVPFADLQAEGRGEATLAVQQRLDVPAATYGDRAAFRASARFGAQRVEVELIEAGLPPALRDEVPVEAPMPIEGGVALNQRLYASGEGLIGYVTPVEAAISAWGVGRVSLDGRVLTERALVHVTALHAGARSDDGRFQQLPRARPGDLELSVLALGVPELGFVQLGFDEGVRIVVDGRPVPAASAPLLEEAMPYRSLDASAQVAQNRAQGVPDPGPTTLRPEPIPRNALERPLLDADVLGAAPLPTSDALTPLPRGAQVVEISSLQEDAEGPEGEAVSEGEGTGGAGALGAAAQEEGDDARARGTGVEADRSASRGEAGAGGAESADDDAVEGVTSGTGREAVAGAASDAPGEGRAPGGSGRIVGIAPANSEVEEGDVQVEVSDEGIPPANAAPGEGSVRVLEQGIVPANAQGPAEAGVRVLQGAAPGADLAVGPPGIAPMQQGIAPLGTGGAGIEINDGITRSTVTFGPGARGQSTFGPGATGASGFGPGAASAQAAPAETTEGDGTRVTETAARPRSGIEFVPGIAPLTAGPASGLPQGIQPLNAQPAAPAR